MGEYDDLKMKLLILVILVFVFSFASCNFISSEPKEELGYTPKEISSALNAYLKEINPQDTSLGTQTFQYSNAKFLLFVKHYRNPDKTSELARFSLQGLNVIEEPFIAKKIDNTWVIKFATNAEQVMENVNLLKYKYCKKRIEHAGYDPEALLFCHDITKDEKK